MKFQVEAIVKSAGPGVVLAKQITPGDFSLTATARLGGAPVEQQLSSPRALNPDGSLRDDLFAFAVISKADLTMFSIGCIVELTR